MTSAPASTNSDARTPLALLLLCLAAFLPGFFALPVIDRDEARFAQASRQMFESVAYPPARRDPALHAGGLAVPQVQATPRLNKPPMIYWLQTGSAWLFTLGDPDRDAIWMYRVPSLVAGIIAVLLTWQLGAAAFGPAVGRLAAMLMAVAPVIAWEAHQARADMVLLAFTMAAMWALWRVVSSALPSDGEPPRSAGWIWPAAFWVFIAGGVLTKGPITPMIAAFTCLGVCLLRRRWAWLWALRPVLGVFIVVALVAPWIWAVASHVGFDRYLAIIHDEVLGRSMQPKEGHWGPPGYHLVAVNVIFWPGVMLAGIGIARAWASCRGSEGDAGDGAPRSRLRRFAEWFRSRRPESTAVAFVLAWLIPSWIVFELVSTKLPHYTMPLLPALAMLAARAVIDAEDGLAHEPGERAGRLGLGLWLVIGSVFSLLVLALFGGKVMQVREAGESLGGLIVPGILCVGGAIAAGALLVMCWRALRAEEYLRAQHASILAMLPLLVALVQVLLPWHMGLSARAATELQVVDPSGTRALAMIDFHEDSMVFHTRGRIERRGLEDIAEWWTRHPEGLVLLPRGLAPSVGGRVLGEASGFNYSRGKHVDLVWVERAS